jgi:hypothetical protein
MESAKTSKKKVRGDRFRDAMVVEGIPYNSCGAVDNRKPGAHDPREE